MNIRRIARFMLLAAVGLLLQGGFRLDLSPDEMNYHDFAETETVLQTLDAASSYVNLETIGYSYNYRSNPSSPPAYPIYAMRVSADTPASSGDRHDRNGVLFDCACHAREWLTSESCLKLAQYLVNNRTNAGTVVPELLQYADVWIIPMVNPAGRIIDDAHAGDPTQFFQNPDYPDGWRNNADTRLCDMGENPARNFSRGFNDDAAHVFCSSRYRGFAPFSSSEANALRQFVENHTISFAVTSHSNGQLIWNQWEGGDNAGERMIAKAAEVWRAGWALPADQTKYDLKREGVGGGNGQFSAWLANSSDRSGDEIDDSYTPWAYNGDLPLAGDFDSDGEIDDVAVYRTSSGVNQFKWYYDWDHNAGVSDETFGPWAEQTGDRPFAGDFDRDGEIDDVAIFRSSDGTWQYDINHNASTDQTNGSCGTSCQRPFALDYDRDGKVDDRGGFCTSDLKWYYDIDHDCSGDGLSPVGAWGASGDLPLAGDFDRDGYIDDVALYRPSNGMWFYDLDHNGNTDHASGPWGTDEGLPFAGDFNRDGNKDDVGLFIPSTRTWQYDDYHNATFKPLDEGSRRAIQTIMLELPVLDDVYTSSMYIQSPNDGSNGFHPSANAVADMIDDSFIPMALYLIRQGRAPGCPTQSGGTADSAYCPANDAGLVGAKFIPSDASLDSPGVLRSLAAHRTSWDDVQIARQQLDVGAYRLVYRIQNFATTEADYQTHLVIRRWHCPEGSSCSSSILLVDYNIHQNLPGRSAANDYFSILLTQPAYLEGDWYEATLDVEPFGGGSDDFWNNDQKVFKFQLLPRLYLPVISR